jgi:hypothetical protein
MSWDDVKVDNRGTTSFGRFPASEYNAMVTDQKKRGSGFTAVVGKSLPCDYLTSDYDSDSAAIQTAIDYVNGLSGGNVVIKEGQYSLSSGLTLYSNITLCGVGENTVLNMADSVNINMIAGTDISSVTIKDLQIDGNKANNTSGSCIFLEQLDKFDVHNVHVLNAPYHNIAVTGVNGSSQYGAIHNCICENAGHRNILFDPRVIDSSISNNTCLNATKANILVGHGSYRIRVINNFCDGTTEADGIVIHHDAQKCIVSNNTSINAATSGILLNRNVYGCIISNNYCESNSDCGIRINAGLTDGTYGWMTEGNCEQNIVIGNICNNNAIDGIKLSSEADGKIVKRISVRGNMCMLNTENGINEQSGQNQNYIQSNHVAGNGSAQIVKTGSASWVIDNEGFNPQGAQTAPAMPASTATHTNTFGFTCTVSVYGGTVTDIKLDGVSLGVTSGIFTVAPDESVSVTYSAAPTWKWWGL